MQKSIAPSYFIYRRTDLQTDLSYWVAALLKNHCNFSDNYKINNNAGVNN